MICTFFGHKDCNIDTQLLMDTIEQLINEEVTLFYVGHQGTFDAKVRYCLRMLMPVHPEVRYAVVLAYAPWERNYRGLDMSDTIYPEIEGHPKSAIIRRNYWMIEKSEVCVCCIDHTWGGAYVMAKRARRRGLRMISLGTVQL